MSRIVVIGAGLSGLAAACHLIGAGHEVTVVEREPIVGGRCGRLEQDGFAFDTGPVVMTPTRSGVPGPVRRRHSDRRGVGPDRHAG